MAHGQWGVLHWRLAAHSSSGYSVMNPLADWIKKRVHLVMRTPNVAALDGTLVQADSIGLVIELLKGQSTLQKFVPWSAILHVDLIP